MAWEHQGWGVIRCAALCAVLLVVALLRAAPVVAAGVVGTGRPGGCTEAALDVALAGGGLITFDCGAEPVTITITRIKEISADTTIDGRGLITISGRNRAGVFYIGFVSFTLQNLTILNGSNNFGGGVFNGGTLTVTNSTFSGNYATGGGGIYNSGALTVTNSAFSGNLARGAGSGIYNSATLTVTNSAFSDNSATDFGGGIYNGPTATLTVTNSTFSGNSAALGSGAGIYNGTTATLTVTNSTFSGNGASYGAGGIVNAGTLTVTNCTFSGNFTRGAGGGAIAINPGCGDAGNASCPATLTNTIVSDSSSGDNCAGTITDGGHNLDSDGTCGVGPATDPLLDPAGLADNGGPTQTIALQPDSPAIGAGDSEVCANTPVNGVDQRGFVRPGIGHTQCSIGAYEADAIAACTGDCDGNGVVAINELILGVNIVLELRPVDACPTFANAEGMVDIAQLVEGVENALGGCGNG